MTALSLKFLISLVLGGTKMLIIKAVYVGDSSIAFYRK